MPETEPAASPPADPPEGRRPCPAPANFRAEVATYDAAAEVGTWAGPRYRMTYRILGAGPPLILSPGIASTYRGYALMLNRLAERFQTVLYDYPGERPGDGARPRSITHADLVDDVFGLIDHLNFGRAFLVGLSFGSTVTLGATAREPRRFPKGAIQGGFARRRFAPAERLALRFGRLMPGRLDRLPFRRRVLEWNSGLHFPALLADRWAYYVEQNGLTPIGPMAARLDLLARLDLRPSLARITSEVLILQGNEDRIVTRPHFDELCALLPRATGALMPTVGHQPHYTHAEALAQAIADFFLPCAPGGCPNEGNPGAGPAAG